MPSSRRTPGGTLRKLAQGPEDGKNFSNLTYKRTLAPELAVPKLPSPRSAAQNSISVQDLLLRRHPLGPYTRDSTRTHETIRFLQIFHDAENCFVGSTEILDLFDLRRRLFAQLEHHCEETGIYLDCMSMPFEWRFYMHGVDETGSAFKPSRQDMEHFLDLGVTHIDPGSKTDAVDLKMQNDIQHFMEVHEEIKDKFLVVVISGDRDFASCLRRLRQKGFTTALVVNSNEARPVIRRFANVDCGNWEALKAQCALNITSVLCTKHGRNKLWFACRHVIQDEAREYQDMSSIIQDFADYHVAITQVLLAEDEEFTTSGSEGEGDRETHKQNGWVQELRLKALSVLSGEDMGIFDAVQSPLKQQHQTPHPNPSDDEEKSTEAAASIAFSLPFSPPETVAGSPIKRKPSNIMVDTSPPSSPREPSRDTAEEDDGERSPEPPLLADVLAGRVESKNSHTSTGDGTASDISQSQEQQVAALVEALSRWTTVTAVVSNLVHGAGTQAKSLLMEAARRGREDIVAGLLNEDGMAEAVLNRTTSSASRYTALHYAAYHGHAGVVDVLLQSRADVNIRNTAGETALESAQQKGFDAICEKIVAETQLQAQLKQGVGIGELNVDLEGSQLAQLQQQIQLRQAQHRHQQQQQDGVSTSSSSNPASGATSTNPSLTGRDMEEALGLRTASGTINLSDVKPADFVVLPTDSGFSADSGALRTPQRTPTRRSRANSQTNADNTDVWDDEDVAPGMTPSTAPTPKMNIPGITGPRDGGFANMDPDHVLERSASENTGIANAAPARRASSRPESRTPSRTPSGDTDARIRQHRSAEPGERASLPSSLKRSASGPDRTLDRRTSWRGQQQSDPAPKHFTTPLSSSSGTLGSHIAEHANATGGRRLDSTLSRSYSTPPLSGSPPRGLPTSASHYRRVGSGGFPSSDGYGSAVKSGESYGRAPFRICSGYIERVRVEAWFVRIDEPIENILDSEEFSLAQPRTPKAGAGGGGNFGPNASPPLDNPQNNPQDIFFHVSECKFDADAISNLLRFTPDLAPRVVCHVTMDKRRRLKAVNVRLLGTVIMQKDTFGFIRHEAYPKNLYYKFADVRTQGGAVELGDYVSFEVTSHREKVWALNVRHHAVNHEFLKTVAGESKGSELQSHGSGGSTGSLGLGSRGGRSASKYLGSSQQQRRRRTGNGKGGHDNGDDGRSFSGPPGYGGGGGGGGTYQPRFGGGDHDRSTGDGPRSSYMAQRRRNPPPNERGMNQTTPSRDSQQGSAHNKRYSTGFTRSVGSSSSFGSRENFRK